MIDQQDQRTDRDDRNRQRAHHADLRGRIVPLCRALAGSTGKSLWSGQGSTGAPDRRSSGCVPVDLAAEDVRDHEGRVLVELA